VDVGSGNAEFGPAKLGEEEKTRTLERRKAAAPANRPQDSSRTRYPQAARWLFGEEAGLGGEGCGRRGRGGGFAAGDADDAEDGESGEGGAGNEDAIGGGVEVRRGDVHSVVEEGEEVVGDDALDGFVVGVAEAHPEAVELGAAEEDFALGLEVVVEVANEVDGADFFERDGLMLTVGSEDVYGIGVSQAGRIQVAADRAAVGKDDDDFLVGGGWGASFQGGIAKKAAESGQLANRRRSMLC